MAEGVRSPSVLRIEKHASGVPLHRVPRAVLDEKVPGGGHQGVVARVDPFPWSPLEDILRGKGTVLALEGIQDPHNLGAILRSAAAFAVEGVLVEKARSVRLTPIVAKASCGALEHVRLCRVPNLPRALRLAQERGYWTIGTDVARGRPVWEEDLDGPVVIVVGGEGGGIRPVLAKRCDRWISIPCGGALKILNASVAVGVVLYEAARQKKKELTTE